MTILKRIPVPVYTLFLMGLVVFFAACSKKDVKTEEPLMNPSDLGDSSAAGGSGAVGTTASSELQTVYFDYDSSNIRSDAREALKANANWLKSNRSVNVQIAGHCDERGTTEYNIALGQRRANATRDYLSRQGVDKSRMSTISYGEEQPSDSGHDEMSWAKNRRSEFIIVSR